MELIPFILVILFIGAPGVIFLIRKLGEPETWQRSDTDSPPGMHVDRSSIKQWDQR